MRTRKIVAVAATALFAAGAVAFAHGGATGIYKERMDAMMAMGKVVEELSRMMRGETSYNSAAVQEGARVIRSHAGEAMTKFFPEGTTDAPSEARPEIWSDWETFAALADQLVVYAEGLEAAAGNGIGMMNSPSTSMMGAAQHGMMGTQSSMMGDGTTMMDASQLATMPADGVFNMVAQTCSSCHTKFRLEKKK